MTYLVLISLFLIDLNFICGKLEAVIKSRFGDMGLDIRQSILGMFSYFLMFRIKKNVSQFWQACFPFLGGVLSMDFFSYKRAWQKQGQTRTPLIEALVIAMVTVKLKQGGKISSFYAGIMRNTPWREAVNLCQYQNNNFVNLKEVITYLQIPSQCLVFRKILKDIQAISSSWGSKMLLIALPSWMQGLQNPQGIHFSSGVTPRSGYI